MHRQKAQDLSELNDTNIIYFVVPVRISQAVESINFTTIVFTLPHIVAPLFTNQLPIRNVERTCNGSRNVWNSESRCTGTLENAAPHKICCDNFWLYFAAWKCYPCNLRQNHQEKGWWLAKTNTSELLVGWLENSRVHFQKLLCKCSWSRDKIWPQKKIKKISGNYEVTFARKYLYMQGFFFLNTAIFTWIANFFIGDEDIYCQCMIFQHRSSIWTISLLESTLWFQTH